MEAITISTGTVTLLVIAGAFLLLRTIFGPKRDPNEPPYISPTVPYIGHLIGLLTKKYEYYVNLSNKCKLPIYGLAIPGLPGGRVYIINSPALVLAVQRQPKKLSFWAVEATFAVGLAGLSKHAEKEIQDNVTGEEPKPSLFMDAMQAMNQGLHPGEALDRMTKVGVDNLLTQSFEMFNHTGSTSIELYRWVNIAVTYAVTNGIFGPLNPFDNEELCDAFLNFEENTVGLISYPWSSITCAKAYAAQQACDFQRQGNAHTSKHNLSLVDKARLDVINVNAIHSNTTPTAFWAMYHIFSGPAVLGEVRAAVLALVETKQDGKGLIHEIDISTIREVPILSSVLHESLRHYGSGTGTRIVMEDTLLDNKYLLKKDTFIFMPNKSYHFSPSAWGPTVDAFDPHRFMTSRRPPGAFRGFGGGANLCPGRYFAMNEILAMCAMFAVRFELKPRGGGWKYPRLDESNLSLIVNPPKEKVFVDVVQRKEWEGGRWAFKI
ncbi:cytochrome P450 [Cadophora sp. DSE1049]|nr:cytochrome P450 [Cadophora sp. DSE1049]